MISNPECKVPGCRSPSKDERGYCDGHLWILPVHKRTPSEVLELCEDDLQKHWSPSVPFFGGSSRGDLHLPLDWLTARVSDVEQARETLAGILRQVSRRRIPSQMKQKLSRSLDRAVETHLTLLVRILGEGGELWKYSSPPKSWENLCGRAGLAVVKDGEVLWTCLTLMN